MPCNCDYCAAFEKHLESCEWCQHAERLRADPDGECDECFHPMHDGECGVDRGDREGNEGEVAQARGPCPCTFRYAPISAGRIEGLQFAHYQDAVDRAESDAAEQKLQQWKDERK